MGVERFPLCHKRIAQDGLRNRSESTLPGHWLPWWAEKMVWPIR